MGKTIEFGRLYKKKPSIRSKNLPLYIYTIDRDCINSPYTLLINVMPIRDNIQIEVKMKLYGSEIYEFYELVDDL